MDGYTTDYINLIADNLRDRYDNGFPILKELIQNADDAKARSFVFAHHPGFPDAVHPLLRGSGLWFFNDGEFKNSDTRALRSFGINSKAGDVSAIGKFGLGMKSVFHLCEAIFYLAQDGQSLHRQGLNPWKQDGQNPHPDWDQDPAEDWDRLESLATPLVREAAKSWFLLWVPLRRRDQVRSPLGHEVAIISRFPGDDPHPDLDFLDEPGLPFDLAEILPLLKHLERIEHRGGRNAFALGLEADQRLLGERVAGRSSGQVILGDSGQSLRFAGMGAEDQDPDGTFARLKARGEWPRSRYRNERGQEQQAADKTRPEAAALFCSGPSPDTPSDLHWAVFLPVEQGGERLKLDAGNPGHSLILHGQFFIDAGRKKPHGLEDLHKPPAEIGPDPIDDSLLRRTWNQHLAQRVLMPLVIPALEHYAADARLSDVDSASLTRALGDSRWFRTFASHICRTDAWVRVMEPDAGPRWTRAHGPDLDRLRPLPTPPKSDPQRPWQVFPRLKSSGLVPFDVTAPSLSNRSSQWKETELDKLLSEVTGLFTDGPRMDYLADFLASCAGPFLNTGLLQHRLIALLRTGFIADSRDGRRQHAEKSRRLIGFVEPRRRLMLAADLPESVLRDLWGIDSPILLVPRGLEPELVSTPETSENAWAAWLRVLDRHLAMEGADADQQAILEVVVDLIKRLSADTRGTFLRIHEDLRIIAIRDARTGRNRAVSGAEIRAVRASGSLFGFAQGTQERERRGMTPLLAAVLPDARVWLVRADRYRDLFPNEASLPAAGDKRACLAAIGRDDSGRLGSPEERRKLLKEANDPGVDQQARRGLRFLLHGCADHRRDDGQPLWFRAHKQHSVWAKIWGQIHTEDRWGLVPSELADTVPRSGWPMLNVREIDAPNLLDELARSGAGIPVLTDFDPPEREEILSKIEDRGLWQRLPLHTTLTGEPVSAQNARVYLAPVGGAPNDPLTCEATLIAPSPNPTVAAQQRKWLKPLDDRARIEIALGTARPTEYWRTILDALDRLPGIVDEDLKSSLRTKSWLPTRYGEPVKPEDVIDLTGGLADEVRRLVADHRTAHGACYAAPEDLYIPLQTHAAWGQIHTELFSSGESGLGRLGLLLKDASEYHIGPWPTEPNSNLIDLLARCPFLPGWRLLRQASTKPFNPPTAWCHLSHGLTQTLKPERLSEVLDWITENSTDWLVRKAACDGYLRQYLDLDPGSRPCFARLRLANRMKEWRGVADLCTGPRGADSGIDPSFLLDSAQTELLAQVISLAGAGPQTDRTIQESQREIDHTLFRKAHVQTGETLASYFHPWEQLVPTPMIGALVALLAPTFRTLASEYLSPHTFDWLLDQLDEAGDCSTYEELERRKVAVHVIDTPRVMILNLLGDSIEAPLNPYPQTLFAGPLSQLRTYRVQVPLRNIDPTGFTRERLAGLLRATAESLCAEIYPPKRSLARLWDLLDSSDQLAVDAARRKILYYLPFYLRQLSICHDGVSRALVDHDKAFTALAEAGEASGNVRVQSNLSSALKAVERAIVNDPKAQLAVLSGVRGKLADFQYDRSSIPFEIFQNADDAAVELGQIAAHSGNGGQTLPAGAQRFVVECGDDYLRIIHWGRPINDRGPVGFDGERRGFGRDLEKMLILSASDKLPAQGLTGKFGLGFKSTLLACERPRILSGGLEVEVVAGILPINWEDALAAKNALVQHGEGNKLSGTLIELTRLSRDAKAELMGRFQRLAGVLCVFGKAIRSIDILQASAGVASKTASPKTGARRQFAWKPRPNAICPRVEDGLLHFASGQDAGTGALCVRTGSGDLLIALSPDGFRALPDEIPTLWVTAPTRMQTALGFAVNGRFEIDPGRAQLAENSEKNRGLARGIGTDAGEILGELLVRTRAEWPSLRHRLGLAADLGEHDFWHSLWLGLTERWLGRPRDTAAELVRELVLTLLKRLAFRKGSIPSGLAAPFHALVSPSDIHYELTEGLATAPVLGILGSWARFSSKYPAGSLVAPDIGAILKHTGLARPASRGLADLLDILDPPKVHPNDAKVLWRIRELTDGEQDGKLTDQDGWKSKDVRERIARLQFRTEDGGWAEASNLVTTGVRQINQAEDRKEEALRYALAPIDRRLSRDYCAGDGEQGTALAFFLICRERQSARTDDLARWILSARAEREQRAALTYLAQGVLRVEVRERVRGQGWLCNVLTNELLLGPLTDAQRRDLKWLLATDEQIDRGTKPDIETSPPTILIPSIGLAKALLRIYEFWSKEGKDRAARYRRDLYPGGSIDLKIKPESDKFDRSSWLILFAIGAFQSIGRTKNQHHRAAIEMCQQRGWWRTFAETDPRKEPDKWLQIIEDYANRQEDEEQWSLWMGQFPRLYRLSRWLDDYIELFLSINRYKKPFSFEKLRKPRTNEQYGGGGIDPPPIRRTLGIGGHLVVRELFHYGIIQNPLAIPHAYAPIERVQRFFQSIGVEVHTSEDIYQLLCEHLGEAKATFSGDYDIPLRIIAADDDLQQKLFR